MIEIVIAVTIISITLLGLIATARVALGIINASTKNVQATFLLEETMEAVRTIRDGGWSSNIATLAASTDYFLEFNGTVWTTTVTPNQTDGFERTFRIADACRDATDDITACPSGAIDPDTKLITATVSWEMRTGTANISASTYITNLFAN